MLGLTACTSEPVPEIVVPNVVGYRADQAETIIKDAGFEHVRIENVVSYAWTVDWADWVVVAQPSTAGELWPHDEDVELEVGPKRDRRTLELLSEDAPAYAEVLELVGPEETEAPSPEPVAAEPSATLETPTVDYGRIATTAIGTLNRLGRLEGGDLPMPERVPDVPAPGTARMLFGGGWEGELAIGDPASGLIQCELADTWRGPELTVKLSDAPEHLDPGYPFFNHRVQVSAVARIETLNDDSKPLIDVSLRFKSDDDLVWTGNVSNTIYGQGPWRVDGHWDGTTLWFMGSIVTSTGMKVENVDSTTLSVAVTCPAT